MTKIYVVRHAEAEGNLYRRIHGQYDSRVTVNGMRQIEALEQRFAKEHIDACYSSDLLRTRTTAAAVYVPKHLPLRLDSRFREARLGVWEDVPFGQLEAEQPDLMKQFSHNPRLWSVAGSENFEQFSTRFLQAMDEAVRENEGKTVAIFSHGCVIRSMLQCLFPAESVGHCDNTGVSLLSFDAGQYRVEYLNDNSHLSAEISTFGRQQWWKKGSQSDHNLWFRPLRDEKRYCDCRADAWRSLHGPLPDAQAREFYIDALHGAMGKPQALSEAVLGGAFAGVVQLDTGRYAEQNVGYLSFLYLLPELRGKGLGPQLLGQAVSFYRGLGRNRLWLSVSPKNEAALRFYTRHGFAKIGTAQGVSEPLLRLEMPIDIPDL